jgi:hypothetical protein
MDFIQDENFIFRFMYWFVMFSNTFVVWAMSVLRIFRSDTSLDDLGYATIVLAFVGRLFSMALKLYSKCSLI